MPVPVRLVATVARHRLVPIAFGLVLVVAGCRAGAAGNLIEVRNETTVPAHVEFVRATGFLLWMLDERTVMDIAPGTSETRGTYEATTLDIKVGGETLHQPVDLAGTCDKALVELLPSGGAHVTMNPLPGACEATSASPSTP